MNANAKAIEIRSLSKTFYVGLRRKKTVALKSLDLEVERGEIFGFLGPNGAGKTTTIKILVGLLRPDSGTAHLFGNSVRGNRARQQIAYLPELPDFYDYLTPGEFLKHCGRLSGLDYKDLRQRIPEILDRVGLNPIEKRAMRKFSKGMLQRVGIAQTLLADPDLYIMDEPQGGLDPLGRRWVKDLILELAQAGKTVFFSSHVLADAEAVCDRVAFLQNGQLIAQGTLRDLIRAQPGQWEVMVEGSAVLADEELKALTQSGQIHGENACLVPAGDAGPDALLPALLAKGYRIRSVKEHFSSLEEIFIDAMDNKPRESAS